tara:strand:- start:326 stop:511 length:186 start_codon:yes stop_codon:yes gene_type:complete
MFEDGGEDFQEEGASKEMPATLVTSAQAGRASRIERKRDRESVVVIVVSLRIFYSFSQIDN